MIERVSARPRQGRRFAPTAELAVVERARLAARSLPGAHRGLLVVEEMTGPQGIPDLAAVVGPPEPLRRRLESGVPPLLNEIDAGMVAAASESAPRTLEVLARELGWPTTALARRVDALVRSGALQRTGSGLCRHPDVGPIGRLYAIEAKVRDGGAALRQVRAYTTWADAYVIVTGPLGAAASARLEEEVGEDRGGLVVDGRWLRRPRLRLASKARRLWSAEHVVAAVADGSRDLGASRRERSG